MTRVFRSAQYGLSLIELIMFIVIVSVGVLGILSVLNVTVKNSADPMIRKQALAVAEAMLEEVLTKDYQNDRTGDNASTPALGCTPTTTPQCRPNTVSDRPNYNDVDDYNNWVQTGVKSLLDTSTDIFGLATYTVTVTVAGTTALNGIPVTDAKVVTVTVAGGNETVTLVGFRANYD